MLHRRKFWTFVMTLILMGANGRFPLVAHAAQSNDAALTTPSNAKSLAHFIMGTYQNYNGSPHQAISEFKTSLKYNPQANIVHLRLGAYYLRLEKFELAQRELKTVIAHDPSQIQAHYLLAIVYSAQNKNDLAARSYESILKYASSNDPGNHEISLYLAQLYLAQQKYTLALAQIDRVLHVQPNNVSALYLLGTLNLEIHKEEDAIDCFRRALSVNPDDAQVLNSLAYVFAQRHEHLDEALKMARHALRLDSSNGAYYDTLGWVMFNREEYAEALIALQKAEHFVTDPIIFDHMGDVYHAVDEPSLAIKFWRKSIELEPKQPAVIKKIQSIQKPND